MRFLAETFRFRNGKRENAYETFAVSLPFSLQAECISLALSSHLFNPSLVVGIGRTQSVV